MISASPNGLYVLLRAASEDRPALGFVVKLWRDAMFSERNGKWRGFRLGPLYVRTYHRKAGAP